MGSRCHIRGYVWWHREVLSLFRAGRFAYDCNKVFTVASLNGFNLDHTLLESAVVIRHASLDGLVKRSFAQHERLLDMVAEKVLLVNNMILLERGLCLLPHSHKLKIYIDRAGT